jgi:hypothetical protein
VRLKGSQGSAGAAAGVKVFFRIWGTQSADVGWDPSSTYLSHNDASNNPQWPLAPNDNHTVPFFATSASPNFGSASDAEFATGGFTNAGANNQTITILQGDSQWAYFGCFLDVNDSSRVVNGVSVSQAFPGGTHHCLVAQIAYDGAPIQTVGGSVPTPESSDQLAQRNMQVTTSDNPGPASAHRVPQTFEVKPSAAPLQHGPLAGRTDELMIDWGEVPVGSTARIYLPKVSSNEVLALASWMYGTHPLSAFDAHTIECKTIAGVTFVPIPHGVGGPLAGLFTVDLPQTVTTGEEFDIVVRRISKRPVRKHGTDKQKGDGPPAVALHKAPPMIARAKHSTHRGLLELPQTPVKPAAPVQASAVAAAPAYERYIVGSFQVKIPVSTGAALLPSEENTLAILKARLAALPKSNRWYPVLLRYIDQIAGRVTGFGGDPEAIPPNLLGYHPGRTHHGFSEFTGKVVDVIFDCHGDFIGFVLEDCCKPVAFESREKEIGELALRALRERLNLTVFTASGSRRIVRLVVKT